jgi:hypothetical protein
MLEYKRRAFSHPGEGGGGCSTGSTQCPWGENIKQPKGNECSQYKSSAANFSSSLPICPVYFHLVMPRHVLSQCYACYEHTRGIKRYATYYLACYVRLQVQNMPYYMRLRVQNMPGCHLRKHGWGKWADWRKK